MSKNIKQVYDTNPQTVMQALDLIYGGRSPYELTDDIAILFSDFVLSIFSSNRTASFQAFGLGKRSQLSLADADFTAGVYVLTNPCPNIITLNSVIAGKTLQLPSAQGSDSFELFTGPEIINIGTQNVNTINFLGIPQTTSITGSDFEVLLTDNSTTGGQWDFIPQNIVSGWDGSFAQVKVTAGSGIDITNGVISLTGTGASAALASAWVINNNFSNSFTDAGTFKGIRVDNLHAINVNFVTTIDGSSQVYFQYVGTESAEFRIGLTNRIRTVSNVSPNSYNYSIGIDSGSGIVPIYSTQALMPFVTEGNTDLDAIIVPYNITVMLNPNDKIYPIINNNGDLTPANNEYIVSNLLVDVQKVGDVGGTLAGVTSLNGLTGIIGLTSPNSTLNIGTSGSNVTLDLNNSNFSTTNGILYFNGTNIVNSNTFTWDGSSVLTVSTVGSSIQSILSTSASGLSNFAVYRSSRGDQTNGLAAYQWDTGGIAKWISAMFPATASLTSNADDLIFRSFSGSQVVLALGQTSYNVTLPAGNLILSGGSKTVQIASLTASQAVVTDSSKNLISLAYASANTASTLVQRDGSGNFSAGTITASLSGNATTSTTTTTATNANNVATTSTSTSASFFPLFVSSSTNSNQPINLGTGLTFNPSTNILSSTGLNLSGLTASQAVVTDSSKNLISLAYTSANTVSTLVQRDSSGNFSAGTITASLSGNSTTSTTATNATNVSTTSTTTNSSFFPLFVSSSSNSNQAASLSSVLTFNPNTNVLSIAGANATPNITVSSSVTGSSNQPTITISRGDQANGLANMNFSTAGTTIWFSGMASTANAFTSNSNDYVFRANSGGGGIGNVLFLGASSGDVTIPQGNMIVALVDKGIQIKGAAVSAGTANASFVSNVVLTGGASGTINNSFVTTACAGFASVSTAGGTPGLGYRVTCNAGSFVVTSSNALDTSTLNVVFIKGI